MVQFKGRPDRWIYGPAIPQDEVAKILRVPYPDKIFTTNIRNKISSTQGRPVKLREDQVNAMGKSISRLNDGVTRQLMSIATGWGKGALFAALRKEHELDGKVMVLVHTDELAQQAVKKLENWNPGHMIGLEMATSRCAPMDTFIVGSVATLGRKGSSRIKKFEPGDFSAIISDEVHHLPGDTRWQRIMDHFGVSEPGSGILSLGLTATPNRSDGKGLRPWYDEVVFERSLLDCIKMGLLCDLKCYAIRTDASLDNVHIKAGKFNDAELSKEINTPERNSLIVRSWMKHAFEKRTLGFTQNVQHALDLAEVFKAFAVSAVAVWGEDPERDAKVKAHRNGEYTVMLNAQMLREGYDDDKIECVLLAAPHLSPLPVAQEVGRVTRIPDDVSRRFGSLHEAREAGYPITKEYGIVLDFVDSSRHPLCTVPSLMGLPKDLDLKGAPASKAKERLERVAQQFPTANLADLKDLSKLDAITKQIELFTVKYPVEIKTLTELAWRQQGEGYWLPVDHGRLTLAQDLRGDWWTRGTIAGKPIEIHAQNLAGAFNAADRAILETGNKALYVRDARWRDTVPSEKQISLCRKLKIAVPNGATRGQVSAALDQHFAARRV